MEETQQPKPTPLNIATSAKSLNDFSTNIANNYPNLIEALVPTNPTEPQQGVKIEEKLVMGTNRMTEMAIGLSVFARNASFDRNAFNEIVAFDEVSGQPLPSYVSQAMIDVALQAGFLTRVENPNIKGERYIPNKDFQDHIEQLTKKEEN